VRSDGRTANDELKWLTVDGLMIGNKSDLWMDSYGKAGNEVGRNDCGQLTRGKQQVEVTVGVLKHS